MFVSERSLWVRPVLFSMCKDVLSNFAAGQVAATDGMSYSPLVVCKACVCASCSFPPVDDANHTLAAHLKDSMAINQFFWFGAGVSCG